jgi:outer membrane biosynthesis protein TonB
MKRTLAVILALCVLPGGAALATSAQSSPPAASAPAQTGSQPTGTGSPQAPPADQSSPEHPQQQPQTSPPPADTTGSQTPPTPPQEPPSSPGPAKTKSKKKNNSPASGPRKRIIRDGGTGEPTGQLSPGMSSEQASHSRQTTSQLLAATETNLRSAAARTLTDAEQAMVAQIRKFMEQANSAVAAGDLQRGRRLAIKAHLLSDDLVKH